MAMIRFSNAVTGRLVTGPPIPAQEVSLSFKDAWLGALLPASDTNWLVEGHAYKIEVFSDPVYTDRGGSRYHTKIVDVQATLSSKRPVGGSVACRFIGAWMPAANIEDTTLQAQPQPE